VTQDSQARVDHAAWQGFLDLLRRFRPRRPINGALVALSLPDLAAQSAAERAAHARAIRKRIKELHERLHIRFPVYVLFTKADLISGFIEYFGELSEDERAQVWGMTFPDEYLAEDRSPIARYGEEYDLLVQRLDERRIDLVQQGVDLQQRSIRFRFPQQFGALRGVTEEFLQDVFEPGPLETRAMLRGVYFTSGTQQGTPIDRVLGALAADFGLHGSAQVAAVGGEPRSYFVGRLFRELIFPEAALAGTDPAQERRRRWRQRFAYGGTLAVASVTLLAWANSYRLNQRYVNEVEAKTEQAREQIDALEADNGSVLRLLPAVNTLSGLTVDADAQSGSRLARGFGLDQSEKLGGAARDTYEETLRRSLLPLIVRDIARLVRESRGDPERLYEALRLYLLFRHDKQYQAQAPRLRAWLENVWVPRFSGEATQASLAKHVQVLLANFPGKVALDNALIADARGIIAQMPDDARAYARLVSEGVGPGLDIPDFVPARKAGDFGTFLFRRRSGLSLDEPIPALFTYRGYFEGFEPKVDLILDEMAADSWLLGGHAELKPDPESLARIKRKVRGRYLAEYERRWVELIGDIEVIPLSDSAKASEVLHRLSLDRGSGAPLETLIRTIAAETRLEQAPKAPEAEGSPGAAASAEIEQTVRTLGGGGLQSASPDAEIPEAGLVRRFRELHGYAPLGQPAPLLSDLLDKLQMLSVHMDEFSKAIILGDVFRDSVGSDNTTLDRVATAVADMPTDLQPWLVDVPDDCNTIKSQGVKAQLNRIWASEGFLPTCRRVTGEYPMNPGSRANTPLEDFAQVFGPNGLMERFVRDYLQDKVTTTADVWRAANPELGLSEDALARFKQAREVTRGFFGGGGDRPSISFDLEPFTLDGGAMSVALNIEGQRVPYEGAATRSVPIVWPGPAPGQVHLDFDAGGGLTRHKAYDGPWAFFRLLDNASLQRRGGGSTEYRLTVSLGGYGAAFNLRAHRSESALDLRAWRSFRCPASL
jgi:type VI secretion system protein ImpL